jgi:ubiquinone/menaquinone biosynthesis C-methylase UbiE
MGWIILAVLGTAVPVILFVLLTDGRYFGKPLVRWLYDRLGPSIFGTQSETARWQALAQELHLAGGEQILDVGTAIGDLPLALAAMPGFCGQVVGVDWSTQMIATAQKNAVRRGLHDRARFQVVDVREGLPFRDGEFDVVCCIGLLETWPHPEQILGELCRVLAPGGALVLSLYRGLFATSAALSLKWYQEHLAQTGLTHLRVTSCRRTQDLVIARSRAISSSAPSPRADARARTREGEMQ